MGITNYRGYLIRDFLDTEPPISGIVSIYASVGTCAGITQAKRRINDLVEPMKDKINPKNKRKRRKII